MIPTSETSTVEFKVKHSNTYLKTVSAYANYGTGVIFFGVSDSGEVVGVENPAELLLKIEQQLNTTVEPRPRYSLSIVAGNVIRLDVFEGFDKPYQYQGKAYRRGGSSTVEVDRSELQNLFLQGANRSFDELPVRQTDLSFNALAVAIKERKGLSNFSSDTLKTLGLYTDMEGFNQAALLFADTNTVPGIDIIRFGSTIDEFAERLDYSGKSIILQFQEVVQYFSRFYTFEKVDGFTRVTHERIPKEAFREAVANALAHRDWSVSAAIRVAFFDNQVEIISPGGLPCGVSEDDYLNRYFSFPRNPLVVTVFRILGYIEGLGTGIERIRRSYESSPQVPIFEVTETNIRIVLPVVANLDSREEMVLDALGQEVLARAELERRTGFSKAMVIRILGQLEQQGLLIREGAGPATRYRKA